MKKIFTPVVAFVCMIANAFAQPTQTCLTENFNSAVSGWTFSQGASQGTYSNPANNCANENGIITPGVGGNNPASITTPGITSVGGTTIQVSFDIFRFNSNLACNTWSDFGCPTSMDIFYWVGAVKYTGLTDLVLPAGGPGGTSTVSCNFAVGNNLPVGTVYKIEIAFKPKSGIGNCTQPGTKYVLDNFKTCQITCNNCTIDAQNDTYCLATNDPITVSGTLSANDLSYPGAILTYTLVNGPFANGSSTIGGANLTINPNGTFTIVRTDMTKTIFEFTYKVADAAFGLSDLASGKVCFPDAAILPVIVSDFSVKREGYNAILNWTTAAEHNAAVIEIEKMSAGGFVKTGSVPATNMDKGSTYRFTERNTATSATQYRLKFIDKDGNFIYSEIKTLKGFGMNSESIIFPNPTNGASSVTVSDISSSDRIQVIDNAGRVVLTAPAGSNGKINTSNLQRGIYFIKVSNAADGKQSTTKLVVN